MRHFLPKEWSHRQVLKSGKKMVMQYKLKLALRYLAARKMRTGLTTLAIVIGVMITFGMSGLIPAVEISFQRNLLATPNQADISITSASRGVFDMQVVSEVADVQGVEHATGALVRPIILPDSLAPRDTNGRPISAFMLVGIDPESAPNVRSVNIETGHLFQSEQENSLIISRSLSEITGFNLGDILTLPTADGTSDFEIVGVIEPRPSFGIEEICVPLLVAQEMLNLPGQINTVEVKISPGVDEEGVTQSIFASMGEEYKIGVSEGVSEIQEFIDIGEIVFSAFGLIALIMGGFVILNTFRTIVAERYHDIGMLRSIGASPQDVMFVLLFESLVLGVLGTSIGLFCGYVFIYGLIAFLNPFWEQRLHFRLMPPEFTAGSILLAICLGIGASLIGGVFPAISASRVQPIEALRRGIAGAHRTWHRNRFVLGLIVILLAILGLLTTRLELVSLGVFAFIVGLVLITPGLISPIARLFGTLMSRLLHQEGSIASGNLTRHPDRAAITASAVMIGLALVLAVASLVTSTSYGVFGYIDDSLYADFLLMPQSIALGGGNVGVNSSLSRKLKEIPEITQVATLRRSTTRIDGMDLQVVGIDPIVYPQVSGLTFTEGGLEERAVEEIYASLENGRSLIANELAAKQMGLSVGQDVVLLTPDGDVRYQVEAIGTDYINLKVATVFISQRYLEIDFHEIADLVVMIDQLDHIDPAYVRQKLDDVVIDYPAFDLYSSDEWRLELEKEGNAKLAGLYLILGVLAVPSLIALVNTLGINIIERRREIGILRAVGATRKQISRIVITESLLLAGVGTGFGIVSGIWLGYVLLLGMNVTGFELPYFFPYSGVLVTIAVGIMFGVFAAVIPARRAAQTNLSRALQFE